MSFGRLENYFEATRRVMEFRFILPDDLRYKMNFDGTPNPYYARPTKLMVVLNGYTHNNLEWLMHTNIVDVARKYNVAVFLPSGENCFYTNCEGCNDHFADYVGDELVHYVVERFGLSADRGDHYVMGLSMGGFGALHTGLAYPQNFSKIAAFSSALILHEVAKLHPGDSNAGGDYAYYSRVFGKPEDVLTSNDNPEQLILNMLADGTKIPDLYLACGNEDFLLEPNLALVEFLKKNNVPHIYHQSPGGHDYNFWLPYTERAVRWMIGEPELEESASPVSGMVQ